MSNDNGKSDWILLEDYIRDRYDFDINSDIHKEQALRAIDWLKPGQKYDKKANAYFDFLAMQLRDNSRSLMSDAKTLRPKRLPKDDPDYALYYRIFGGMDFVELEYNKESQKLFRQANKLLSNAQSSERMLPPKGKKDSRLLQAALGAVVAIQSSVVEKLLPPAEQRKDSEK